MSGTFSQAYAPQFAGGAFQVASQFLGQSIIDGIRKQFPRRKTQRGEFYMDQACHLIHSDLAVMKSGDQNVIQILLERAMDKREKLNTAGDSLLEKASKAREFKFLAKELYIVTKRASDRGKGESLLNQIKQATGAIELNNRNPFADPTVSSSFTNSSADSLERVEMDVYETNTGDAAVALTLHGQGMPPQEVAAGIPSEVLTDMRADRGVQTVMVVDVDGDPQEPRENQGE